MTSKLNLPRRAVSFLAVRLPHAGDSCVHTRLANHIRVSKLAGTARNDHKEPNRHE